MNFRPDALISDCPPPAPPLAHPRPIRMTEDLLVGSLPPGRLTMRSGYSAEDDYLPVSPGLAVPRAVGLAGGADAPGGA